MPRVVACHMWGQLGGRMMLVFTSNQHCGVAAALQTHCTMLPDRRTPQRTGKLLRRALLGLTELCINNTAI